MKVVSVRRQFSSVAGAATAVAVAATVLVAPPGHVRAQVLTSQIHAVQLEALAASAVLNAVGGSAVPLQTDPRPDATASASGPPDLFTVAVAIGLGAVLIPLWYLAAPVTLPMTILFIGALGGVCSGCYSGSSNGAKNPLANIILPGIQYWLTGPIQRIFNLFSPGSSAASAVGRSKAISDREFLRSAAATPVRARVSARSAAAQVASDVVSQDHVGGASKSNGLANRPLIGSGLQAKSSLPKQEHRGRALSLPRK